MSWELQNIASEMAKEQAALDDRYIYIYIYI